MPRERKISRAIFIAKTNDPLFNARLMREAKKILIDDFKAVIKRQNIERTRLVDVFLETFEDVSKDIDTEGIVIRISGKEIVHA